MASSDDSLLFVASISAVPSEARSISRELEILLGRIGRPIEHPFWGSTIQRYLPDDRNKVLSVIESAKASLVGLEQSATQFPLMVAPPIWRGISPHHMAFPGTISLRLETYHALIRDVCTSIARHGFTRIMILNGHGGNASPLAAIAQELSATGLFVAVVTYFVMIAEDLRRLGECLLAGMSHAGEMETSLQMVLQPSRVDRGQIKSDLGQALTPYFQVDMRSSGTVYYPYDLKRDSQKGVIGDPILATPEKGRLIFEAAVSKLVDFIQAYREISNERPRPA